MKPGEERVVENGPEGTLIGKIRLEDGTFVREIPSESCPEDDKWPLSVLILDHGGIGAGGSEYVENCEDMNVLQFSVWDWIHQMIRDCKNAVHAEPAVEKIMATAAYVFSLNEKPFNSGEWQRHKAEILHVFCRLHDGDSPIFVKYCDEIAKELRLPYDGSVASRQEVFDALCELASFLTKGSKLILLEEI